MKKSAASSPRRRSEGAEGLVAIADALSRELGDLPFTGPAAFVYNPLEYAREPYRRYLLLYGEPPKEVLLLGMNPGPWGMVQTGVPFGDVEAVRGWLGVTGPVGRPPREHPRRPVLGFRCRRRERSGERLWGWAAETFGTPERFFRRFFVANYCPLAFFDGGGANITPDRLAAPERAELLRICDGALRETVGLLRPGLVVGVGRFAEERARRALAGLAVRTGGILHPSPASPAANRGWSRIAGEQLLALGVVPAPGRLTPPPRRSTSGHA